MEYKIALAGNPNCGKTTMFNDLTGSSQYVGNWPGVTVEKKEGKLKVNKQAIIQDLPGIYSLSPYTLEEVVSRNYLVTQHPDAMINIVDASNLERNLYLTTQLLEIGVPMVISLNMMDLVRKNGDKIDVAKLSQALGCQIIETSALKGEGSAEVAKAALTLAQRKSLAPKPLSFDPKLEETLSMIQKQIAGSCDPNNLRWFAIKLFERDEKAMEQLNLSAAVLDQIEALRQEAEAVNLMTMQKASSRMSAIRQFPTFSKPATRNSRQNKDLPPAIKLIRLLQTAFLRFLSLRWSCS